MVNRFDRGAMLRAMPLLLLFVLFVPAQVRAQESTQDTTKLVAPLRTARASLNEAWRSMNGAKAAVAFGDSAVVEFGDQVITGKAGINDWLTQTMGGLSSLRLGTPSFRIGANEVTESNTYVVVTADGSEQPGSVTTIWRRQRDGAWKVSKLTVM